MIQSSLNSQISNAIALKKDTIINNRYKIIRHLGTGGMGSVYLVEDVLYDSIAVALKQIDEEKINPVTLRSFRNEFKAMTRLKHPNLAQVYDFGFDQSINTYYITLEYVEGYSLQELRNKRYKTSSDHLLSTFVYLCRALAFMHSRGIVHRDINPGNIMCSHTGQVKIMDFGLVDIEMEVHRSKGTLGYMAPEVVKGKPDFRTDIFSFGLTFYELLTDTSFYNTLNVQQIITLLCNKDAFCRYCTEKLTARFANDPLGDIVEKMLAFDPEDRFQSGTEIIGMLNRVKNTSYPFETAETREAYVLGAEFIGREHELSVLKAQCDTPHATAVWVCGDAGVGKSRLFYEFKNWCQLQTISFLEGTCYENITKQFGPFLPIIGELLLSAPQECIDRHGPELIKILPDHPSFTRIAAAGIRDPKSEYAVMVKTIAQGIIDCIKKHPRKCVLYLNDMQWSDQGSIEILDTLLQLAAETQHTDTLHLYISSRIDGSEALDTIREKYKIQRISLPVFGIQSVQSYITAVFGKNGIGPQLQQSIYHIHEKVGGNPLFLQELVKSLISTDILVRTEQWWDLAKPLDQTRVPRNLEELIIAHLNRIYLTQEELRVLHIIVLLNRSVAWQELNRMCRVSSNLLKRLEHAEFLKTKQKGLWVFYEIAHDLIRNAIGTTIQNRPVVHEQIASSLEKIHASSIEPYLEEIAYHFFHAGNHDKALNYLKLAMEKTKKNYEKDKPVMYCDMILEILDTTHVDEKVTFLNEKAEILGLNGKQQQAIQSCKEAALLAEQTGNNGGKAKAYYHIAFFLNELEASPGEAIDCLQKALHAYEAVDDKEGIADTYMVLGYSYYYSWKDYDTAMKYLDKGMIVAQEIDNKKSIAYILGNICQVYEARGEFNEALECVTKTIELLEDEELINKYPMIKRDIALYIGLRGFYYACNGEYFNAIQCLDRQIYLSEKLNITGFVVFGMVRKAQVLLTMKCLHEAKRICDTARNLFNEVKIHEVTFIGAVIIARVEYATGNRQKGIQILTGLLKATENKYEIAKLCYELWRMTSEEPYRNRSLNLYRTIAPKTKNWLYLKRLKELEQNKPSMEFFRTRQQSRLSLRYHNYRKPGF